MDTNAAGLAGAIQELTKLARANCPAQAITIPAHDGKEAVSVPALVVQKEGRQEVVSLAQQVREASDIARALRLTHAAGPDRRQGTAQHQSLASFILHANRFKDAGSTIWADPLRRALVAVLDYHPEGAASDARWCRHRGTYECPLSDAWLAWGGEKGLELSQDEFAEMLDARDRDLSEGSFATGQQAPSPGMLITMATTLETYSSAKAKRERNQAGRLQISYSQESGVGGSVPVPAAFLVSIPIFRDSPRQQFEVRLRVDVEEGAARFRVRLHAASDVLRAAFEDICTRVKDATDLPVFAGTPEASS